MKFPLTVLLSGLLLLAPTILAATSKVHIENGELTAHFEDAPLGRALQQLSAATGVQFMLDQQLAEKLNVSVQNLPVAAGIERVLNKLSHVAYYRPADFSGGKPVLYRVKVFKEGAEKTADYQLVTATGGAGASASTAASSESTSADSGAVTVIDETTGTDGVAEQAAQPGDAALEVAQAQEELATARHKAVATNQALRNKIAQLRRDIAVGEGDPQAKLQELAELENELERSQQSGAQEIILRQVQLNTAVAQLNDVETPQTALTRSTAIRTRQLRSNSVSTNAAAVESEAIGGISWLGKGNNGSGKRNRHH